MHTWGIKSLRISLGIVYIWFGVLKILLISPIDPLIHELYPFLPSPAFCYLFGAIEALIGLGLLINFKLRIFLVLTALHLLGTFACFFIAPPLFFKGFNPLHLTLYGEFIAKNLVLLAAIFTLWQSTTRPASRNP